jgi:spore coat protein CotH
MKSLSVLLSLFLSINAISQSLPDEMYFSPDGKILYTGGVPSTGLYDPSIIKSFYLTFPQSNYWTQLTNNYTTKVDLPAMLIVDGNILDSVGVRFKGMTSYMQSSGSEKKSFNLKTNAFIDGQDLMGYNITNLNNAFQDPSFLREVFYQSQIRNHIPAAKSCFVKLYINGENWGVYPNVQQLNKDFLKEWFMNNDGTNWRADRPTGGGGAPGWGDGTAALNFHSNDTADYKQYYTLKSSNQLQPWEDLVDVCQVLDTASVSTLENSVANVLDLDRTLWYLASEIIFSDDDSYIYKGKMDYYVYYDEVTGRMTPLEYDANSVMETNTVTWSPFYNATNANYPLLYKLLAVPSIRQRYLAHFRTLIEEALDSTTAIQKLDGFKSMIDTMVQNDPKKLYTYSQFTSDVDDLKDFIVNRRNYVKSNSEVNKIPPTISNVNYISSAGPWISPTANEDVIITSDASSTYGIDHLNMYYATGIYGNFTKVLMYDDGAHGDGTSGDGIFGATLPGQSSGQWVRFYVEAVAANTEKTVSYSPKGAEHNVYVFQVTPSIASNINVTINEVMASNTITVADSLGEYDDWIEIYNLSTTSQDISGYYLTDNSLNLIKFEFPAGTIIAPNDYLIVWADEDGSQGDLHANFKLSGSGEHLLLLNNNLEIVDEITFGTQTTDIAFARVPNGTGSFINQSPTFDASNNLNTSIDDISSSNNGISVYPNPASDKLKIYLSSKTGDKVLIYNSVGEIVYQNDTQSDLDLNISDWANGFYIIRSGDKAKKILVQR